MLQIANLSMHFQGEDKEAVKNLSLDIKEGEIHGLVGESGSGKTITALTIAGLGKAGLQIDSGSILLDDLELLQLKEREWRHVQGKDIGMIFQEPYASLNPTMKIGRQVEEALLLHTDLKKKERVKRVIQALEEVELTCASQLLHKYPHELSGGMRQRVMIAAACILRPKLLIADEPTTALDVQTQRAILDLLKKINKGHKISILFISHNLRVIKELCKKVTVLQDGVVVEQGLCEDVFHNPKHAYTNLLLRAIPKRLEDSLLHKMIWEK